MFENDFTNDKKEKRIIRSKFSIKNSYSLHLKENSTFVKTLITGNIFEIIDFYKENKFLDFVGENNTLNLTLENDDTTLLVIFLKDFTNNTFQEKKLINTFNAIKKGKLKTEDKVLFASVHKKKKKILLNIENQGNNEIVDLAKFKEKKNRTFSFSFKLKDVKTYQKFMELINIYELKKVDIIIKGIEKVYDDIQK